MATYFGKEYTNIGTESNPVWQAVGGSGGGSGWSSGWVDTDGTTMVADGARLIFTHGLGSTDLQIQVYVSDNSSGTGEVNQMDEVFFENDVGRFASHGCQVQDITNQQLTVQLSYYGYGHWSDVGTVSTVDSLTTRGFGENDAPDFKQKYIKVVATKGAGGGSAGVSSVGIPRTQWPVRAVDGLNSPNRMGDLTTTPYLWKYSPQTTCNLGAANSWVFSCVRGLNGFTAHSAIFTRDIDLIKAYPENTTAGIGCSVTQISSANGYNRGGYVICQTGETGWHQVSSSGHPDDLSGAGYGITANIMAYVNPTVVSNVIHDGSTTNSWTNMSTGHSNSLVMLLVEPFEGGAVRNVWFKRSSDNNIVKTSVESWAGHGCAAGTIDGRLDTTVANIPFHRGHYAFCMTDSSGNLSVATSGTSNVKVTLIGYVGSTTTSDSTLLTNSSVAASPEAVTGTGSGEDGTYGTSISTGLTGHNLVLLKTIGTSGTGNNIYLRTPGDSITMYKADTAAGQGCAAGYMRSNEGSYQVAMTDINGNLRAFSSNTDTCTITMIGSTPVQLS